jgi:hypothetical protein
MRRLPTAESHHYQIQTQTHTNPSPDFLPAPRRTRKGFFTPSSARETRNLRSIDVQEGVRRGSKRHFGSHPRLQFQSVTRP